MLAIVPLPPPIIMPATVNSSSGEPVPLIMIIALSVVYWSGAIFITYMGYEIWKIAKYRIDYIMSLFLLYLGGLMTFIGVCLLLC